MNDQLLPDPGSAVPIGQGPEIQLQPQETHFEAPPLERKVFVTWVLIALNVAVFIVMAVAGVGLFDPAADSLLRWGADYGPLTTHGQWWRMFTSTFVHIGILHIAMNMYILFISGPFVEKLFGNLGFAVLYLLAGLGGSLTSLAWHPMLVSAGASGAIFGVYGGLLAYLLMQRNSIAAGRAGPILKNALVFIAFNLVYGASKSNVDMGAHLGGIATGFVVGCVLAQPITAGVASRLARAGLVLAGGLALVAFATTRLPVYDDLQAEIRHFGKVETDSLKLFSDSVQSVKADKISATEFDDIVRHKLLPPWNAEIDVLNNMNLEQEQKGFVNQLVGYMRTRA